MEPFNEKQMKNQVDYFNKQQTHLWPQTAAWNTVDVIFSQQPLSPILLFWLLLANTVNRLQRGLQT